jgi:ABC-type bacteriocin/lantibiotic exporter with double-glycine peptidase domain
MEIIKGGNYRSMKSNGKILEKLRGDIEFENVSFVYPSRPDVYALHNVSMKFGSLRTCAIVGGVGSGKSVRKFQEFSENNIVFLECYTSVDGIV